MTRQRICPALLSLYFLCISLVHAGLPSFLDISREPDSGIVTEGESRSDDEVSMGDRSDPYHDHVGKHVDHHNKEAKKHVDKHKTEAKKLKEKHIDKHMKEHHDHNKHVDEKVAGHVEQGAEPHHTGVNGDCPGHQSANSVVVGLLATVVLVPMLIYMIMCKTADGAVSTLTFKFVDLSISIFLAVLWFSATSQVFEAKPVKKAFPHAEETFAILQVVLLYSLALLVAYTFRENKYYLLTFCGCAGHYIAFAAIRAVGETQHKAQQDAEHPVYASIGFCFLVFAIFAGLSVVSFFAWRTTVKNEEMDLAVEDLEYDIFGLVVSFAIMQALRHCLTGQYPAEAHLLLQQRIYADCGTDPVEHMHTEEHSQHTEEQRLYMLLWSIGLTIVAIGSLKKLGEIKEECSYWAHKAIHVFQVTLVMCIAWGYLLWGEWQFYETYFSGDQMFGKMVFAILATFVCLLIIVSVALTSFERFANARGYIDLVIMAISLVAAFSWEHCFHTALEVVAEQYQVGYDGLVPKLVVALIIPLVILPGYIIFLKPIVVEKDEEFAAEEKRRLAERVVGAQEHADQVRERIKNLRGSATGGAETEGTKDG